MTLERIEDARSRYQNQLSFYISGMNDKKLKLKESTSLLKKKKNPKYLGMNKTNTYMLKTTKK